MKSERGMAILAILIVSALLGLGTGVVIQEYGIARNQQEAAKQQLEIRDIAIVEQGDEA